MAKIKGTRSAASSPPAHESGLSLSHLRRETRTALELAVVALAPSELLERLAASAGLLEAGVRPCLFTDLANPTSNGVYTRIGYRPVRDTVELTFTDQTDWAHGLA